MLKNSSPPKVVETVGTSAKARFFYAGVFAMEKKKEQLSQPRSASQSQDKKSIRKWSKAMILRKHKIILLQKVYFE